MRVIRKLTLDGNGIHLGIVKAFDSHGGEPVDNDQSRKMRLVTPLNSESVMLTRLFGSEKVSGLYGFELDVQTPRNEQIVFNDLLGQDIRVDIELPGESWDAALTSGELAERPVRRFCGIVQKLDDMGFDEAFRFYKIHVRPRFWLLTQTSDCRIFQEKSVPDILQTVLDGLNTRFQLKDGYHARPYCVQYNETSYDFVRRIMSEEGMFYFFEHQYEGQDDDQTKQGERLVISDSVVSLPNIMDPNKTDSNDCPVIEFEDIQGGNRSDLRIHRWQRSQQIVSTKSYVRDHSFQLPGQSLEAEEGVPEQIEVGGEQHKVAPLDQELETYNYPGGYAKHYDGVAPGGGLRPDAVKKIFDRNVAISSRNVARHASQSLQFQAASNCPHLVPGHKFSIRRDFELSGPFLVTEISHDAKLNSDYQAGGDSDPNGEPEHSYNNRFSCHPEVQPFQPLEVERPKILGFQTATVVGPENEEAFSDPFGRIKVQFHWDRLGQNDADSSCWIRVSQIWAGNRWGAFFWPRVGHEVVVVFENGDPDCPMIVGSVYNAENMPPLTLPNRLQSSGIKSCSFGGNPIQNFSCMIFHDGPGQEYLQVHSETHECVTSETTKIGFAAGPRADFQGSSDFPLPYFSE